MLTYLHQAPNRYREDAYQNYCHAVEVYGGNEPASFIAVTVLRSPSSAVAPSSSRTVIGDFDGSGLGVTGVSGAIHWPQNLKPSGFSKLQLRQSSASAVVHCPQTSFPEDYRSRKWHSA
jgi:hypothetical protein